MSIELVAFDFDGTLVHTAPDIILATNAFLELHGRPPLADDEIITHIGMGLLGLIHGVVPEAAHHPGIVREIESQFGRVYDGYILNNPRLFDGAEQFIKTWPRKMAIVSNKPERYIRLILKHLQIHDLPWAAIVGGDTLSQCKPDPLPLRHAMEAAGCGPDETLMVGDGPPDIGVALACKTKLLAVSFGYSPLTELQSLGAEHSLDHFNDLKAKIMQLEAYL
jgi:phosphoglycolate phosphatase